MSTLTVRELATQKLTCSTAPLLAILSIYRSPFKGSRATMRTLGISLINVHSLHRTLTQLSVIVISELVGRWHDGQSLVAGYIRSLSPITSAITIHLDTNDTDQSVLAYLHLMARHALRQDIGAIRGNLSLSHLKAKVAIPLLDLAGWLVIHNVTSILVLTIGRPR